MQKNLWRMGAESESKAEAGAEAAMQMLSKLVVRKKLPSFHRKPLALFIMHF